MELAYCLIYIINANNDMQRTMLFPLKQEEVLTKQIFFMILQMAYD